MLGEAEMRDIDERREQIMSHQPKCPCAAVNRCKTFARKFLRCGVVAFADEVSSLSLQNNKIKVTIARRIAGRSITFGLLAFLFARASVFVTSAPAC